MTYQNPGFVYYIPQIINNYPSAIFPSGSSPVNYHVKLPADSNEPSASHIKDDVWSTRGVLLDFHIEITAAGEECSSCEHCQTMEEGILLQPHKSTDDPKDGHTSTTIEPAIKAKLRSKCFKIDGRKLIL